MARTFARASDQHIENQGGSLVTDVPCTIAAWFRPTDVANQQFIASVAYYAGGASGDFMALAIRGADAGDPVAAQIYSPGDSGHFAATTTGVTSGQWHHGVAVFASTTSRTAYIDGGSAGSNTTSVTLANIDTVCIGSMHRSNNPTVDFDGDAAEVGFWNVALTAAEAAMLATGIDPRLVRPASLIMYVPCVRDEDRDITGGVIFSATNSPTVGDHPRIFKIPRPWMVWPAQGAVGALTINVSDSVSVSESIAVTVSNAQVSTSEAVSVAETITAQLVSFVSVSDAVSIAETITAQLVSFVSVSDAVSIAETVTAQLVSFVSVSDAVSIAETVTAQLVSFVSVSDSVNVAETITARLTSFVSASESVTVAESIKAQLVSFVSVSDAVSVAETVSLTVVTGGAFGINVSDAVNVGETISVLLSNAEVAVSESVSVSETVTAQLVSFVSVSDSVSVAETITARLTSFVVVTDAVTVSEAVQTVTGALAIAVSDAVSVTDSPTVGAPYDPGLALQISVVESVSVAEIIVALIQFTPLFRTYVVDAENRTYAVESKNRTYSVED